MSGRILIIDPIPTNRIVMRVKLASAFYEVLQASSGKAALGSLATTRPDVIVCACDPGDMDGQTFCQSLRNHPLGKSIPVIVVGAGAKPEDRLAVVSAGADDVLPRPIDDMILLARLRSLLRARDAETELQLRDDTRRALGMAETAEPFASPGRVFLVAATERRKSLRKICEALAQRLPHHVSVRSADDFLRNGEDKPDVVVLFESKDSGGAGLTLLPQLRANSGTRNAAMIYVAQPDQRREAASALDMGANDLLLTGPEPLELALRIDRQIMRKRVSDRLRSDMQDGLRAAVIDPLTGLYNRRYAMPHLKRLSENAHSKRRSFAVMLADVDHFKRVNDHYGHACGDEVLKELAMRLHANLRAPDMLARYGGEEFLIVLPDTDRRAARAAAERMCRSISERTVTVQDGRSLQVTLSIGVALGSPNDALDPDGLIEYADRALYRAKAQGRNGVVVSDLGRPVLLPSEGTRPQSKLVRNSIIATKTAGL
ncbi:diguanylate cyclase [Thalassococcus lentus]|uniref:diguanylate cyclase n=1 Tax=Thalassococcus lentus TaxID=1210524 RepID=A0ABT4XWX2_9RHOB|nr:diguanylate cyclase [Thalassococcus lentus]MDA7426387.1 diguanylate cyclase [Thalassococcus lentus]